MLNNNIWNHFTVCKQMSSNSFKIVTYELFNWQELYAIKHQTNQLHIWRMGKKILNLNNSYRISISF